MGTMIFFLLGCGYIFLFIWGLFLARNHRFFHLTNLLLLVILGLVYDNLIIAAGKFIGEGSVLKNLNYARFLIHALFTPTLILFAWSIYQGLNLPGSKTNLWKILAYFITTGLIIYELLASVKGLNLRPNWTNGVLTYESVGQAVSPFMVIVVTVILGIIGLLLSIKYRFYWLLIGTLIMLSGGILVIWFKDFPVMNILEFLFIASLLLTKQFLIKKTARQKKRYFF